MSNKRIKYLLLYVVTTILLIGISACSSSETASAASQPGEGRMNHGVNGAQFSDPSIDNPERTEEPEGEFGDYQGKGTSGSQGFQGGSSGIQAEKFNQDEHDFGKTQNQGNNGSGRGAGNGGKGQGNPNPGSGLGLGALSEAETEGLLRAIEEEYGAQALYQSIIDSFGEKAPFHNIVKSESQHITALIRMAEKYGISAPEYPDPSDLPIFDTFEEACQAGAAAEIADAELYDELMLFTTHEDLLRLYTNLKNASIDKHLPEFEACQ
jgi:hypothetical protein